MSARQRRASVEENVFISGRKSEQEMGDQSVVVYRAGGHSESACPLTSLRRREVTLARHPLRLRVPYDASCAISA